MVNASTDPQVRGPRAASGYALGSVIVQRSMSSQWLSNTYLVADEHTRTAVMIDAGGPVAPLLELIERERYELTHVLLTHHHHDHTDGLAEALAARPGTPVLIHPLERGLVPEATGELVDGQVLACGGLAIEALHTPGHTAGMISLLVGGSDLFTGDTLFRGSVGGVRAPGHTTYADLRRSIMERLLALEPQTRIHPGHAEPTTVAHELSSNPFVRIWSGLDPEGTSTCEALGEPATLILLARDYDGGHKAWVRWPDGCDDIVPGSRVTLAGEATA
jgi:hydroxyacylglutathione hydrolase